MTNEAKLQNTAAKKQAPKRRRAVSLDRRKARAGWLFVLPFVAGFLLIYLPIIFDSVKLSFFRIEVLAGGGYNLNPVGFDNYREALFVNPDFVSTLVSGIWELVFDIPAILIFSLFMAVLLNQKMAGRAVFRAIFFIPVILATGLIDDVGKESQTVTESMQESQGGDGSGSSASDVISKADVAILFENMKIGGGLVDIVTSLVNDIYNIINRSGVQMLIFLSGLQSISPAIYESCSIDGATAWETFWKITFPMISPMILVNAVYTVIESFTSSSNEVMALVLKTYNDGQLTLSSAMAWMYFILVIVIIAVVAGIISMYTFYQRRD